MMRLISERRGELAVGIIGSLIFFLFIEPILSFLSKAFLYVASWLGDAYVNRIYAQASHLETIDYSFVLLLILYIAGLVVPLALWGLLNADEATKPPLNTAELKELPADTVRANAVRPRGGSFLLLLPTLALFFVIASSTGANILQLSLISTFRQHLRILEPFLTDQEEEVLVSDWSRMKTRKDFITISGRLEQIAKTNNVELPENRLYSIWSL